MPKHADQVHESDSDSDDECDSDSDDESHSDSDDESDSDSDDESLLGQCCEHAPLHVDPVALR